MYRRENLGGLWGLIPRQTAKNLGGSRHHRHPSLASPPSIWEAHGILCIHPWPARHKSCRLMASKKSIPRKSAMNLGGSWRPRHPSLESLPLIWVADGVLGIHLSTVRH